uniref:SAWADEE domain-containing protein n=1 Tax=Aegilops tauschii TaxID=37682 RepID=M8CIZ7_AEGTA
MPKSRKRTPRKPKAPVVPAPPRRPPPRMEYRARSDEAWYGARLVVQDGSLRVMFEDFLEDADEWYHPDAPELASPRAVDALRARFRRSCPALDDARCGHLRPGDQLCLACDMHGGEIKYYDAVLEAVEKAPHRTVDREERCACRFTESPIQDPVLTEFLDDVAKRFGDDQGKATVASQPAPSGEGESAPVSSLTYSSSSLSYSF